MTSRLNSAAVAGGLILAFAAAAVWIAVDRPGQQPRCEQADSLTRMNVQVQLRGVDDNYELELWSPVPFPVRALAPILRIGNRDFGLSRYGAVYDLNTLIFSMSTAEYGTVDTGDPVAVYYGFFPDDLARDPDTAARLDVADGWNLWTFGRFDKSRLDCPRRAVARQ